MDRTRVRRAAIPLLLLLLPPTAGVQENGSFDDDCLTCDPQTATARLTPGTDNARRVITQPFRSLAVDGLDYIGPPALREASPPSCGTVALITGAITAGVGLLLAFVVESAFPWEDERSATSRYLIAGGVGFGVGATYALVRCAHEGRPPRPETR